MQEMFADLHVHIGRSEKGKPIKITAARTRHTQNRTNGCIFRKIFSVFFIVADMELVYFKNFGFIQIHIYQE